MKQVFTALSITLVLAGCSADDKGNENDDGTRTGRLLFHGISGVHYETASQSGTTDANGQFRYRPGETITFSLGGLVLGENVQAKDWVTPVDFDPDQVALLEAAEVRDGLTTHTFIETDAAGTAEVVNKMGLLMTLDDDRDLSNGIQIKQYAIDAIEAFDPAELATIDWSDDENFGDPNNTGRPEVRLINSICFPELTQTICDDPDSGRQISTGPNVTSQLIDELRAITRSVGKDIFVENEYYEIAAGDSDIRTLRLRMIRESRTLSGMEAISTDDSVVTIHSVSPTDQSASFFATGSAGENAEVILNLRLSNDYRWIKKNVRVSIK